MGSEARKRGASVVADRGAAIGFALRNLKRGGGEGGGCTL